MTTCEVCNCTLDGEAMDMPVRLGTSAYYVCCYTCETVMRDTGIGCGASVDSTIT